MSGLFGVLGIASRAMLVNQNQVRTTSHNIANASRPDYSRQRVELTPSPTEIRASGNLGTGVEHRTIERFHDEFVQRQLLREQSAFAFSNSESRLLERVEEVFNEQQGARVGSALSAVYDAFGDIASAASPGAPVERAALLGVARSAIDEIQRADTELRAQQRSLDLDVAAAVDSINAISGRIAELNERIAEIETRAPANDLRDQRDALVKELSSFADVSSFEHADGSAAVLLGGQHTLVDGSTVVQLGAVQDITNPFDPSFRNVVYDPSGAAVDVSAGIGSGSLGAALRGRDLLIPAAIRSLDTLAYNLVDHVNGVHGGGVGLDGSVGDFFQALPGVEDAARDIALDANVDGRPDAIAAGLTTDPGDNRNALELAALRDRSFALFLPGDPPGPATGPTRSLLDHQAGLVADLGQQSRLSLDTRSQRERTLELLENRRDEISAVSIDEEVTNLVQLQRVFQANARVVSTVQELLDSVISMV